MSLIETFRHHSKVLAHQSSSVEFIQHMGERGGEREDILANFLSPLLPGSLQIGRGEIRATNGSWSKQEDLIIYDRLNCPRLLVGNRNQVFPVESVAAVIEVKTRLDGKAIKEATENIKNARSLKKTGMSTQIGPGSVTFGEPTPTLGVLFAFDLGLSLETFRQRWVEAQSVLPIEQRINLTCILGQMVMVHMDHTFHLWDHTDAAALNQFVAMDSQEDSLLTFFLLMMRVLAETRFGVPDLFKYYFGNNNDLSFPLVYKE
jgi:hypothetical protein